MKLGKRTELPPPKGGAAKRWPVLSIDQLSGLELIDDACWVFDIARRRMVWANAAGLEFWEAASVAELLQRDFSSLSPSTARRLDAYGRLFAEGHDAKEQWTFYPNGHAKAVFCHLRPVRIAGGANAMFVRCLRSQTGNASDEERRAVEALRHADLQVSIYDDAGRAIYRNSAAQAAFGPARVAGADFAGTIAEPELATGIWAQLSAGHAFHREAIANTRTGRHWHLIDARVISDPVAGARAYLVCQHEIDQLFETQQRLAAMQERFRDFAEAASDWFWELDAELKFSYLSPGTELRTGEDPGGMIGRRPGPEGLVGVSAAAWQAHVATLEARRPFADFRFALVGPDGVKRHFSTSAKPVFGADGEFLGYRGSGRDVTALVEAQENLRRNERFLREIIDAVPLGITVKDREASYVVANAFQARLCGATPNDIEGTPAAGWFGPEIGARAESRDRQVFETGAPLGPYESRFTTSDGISSVWQMQKVPLTDERGTVRAVLTVGTDITAQKETQAALVNTQAKLLDSELRFRDFAASASDWFWEQDEHLRFTFVSAGNQSLFGLPAEALYGKTRRETNPVGVTEEQWAQHDADLAARRPFADFRFCRVDPAGRRRHLSVSGKPFFDEDGRFKGYRGTGRDVTALAEAEHSLRQMIDNVPAVVNLIDREGRYLRVNEFFAQLCGETPSAMLGKFVGTYSNPATLDRVRAMNRQVLETGKSAGPYETSFRLRDGTERDYLVQKAPMRDAAGNITGVLTVGMEIAALKQAQKDLVAAQTRLQVSEARFRDFAQTASDWFWELDRDLRFSFMSTQTQPRGEEHRRSLIGRKPAREDLLGVSDDAWQAHLADLESRRPIVDFRFSRAGRDGRLRHFSVNGKPLFDEHGTFQGYRGTGRDMTALVEAEEFLRHVVDSVPAVIAVRDTNQRYILVNAYYAKHLCTTPEAARGAPLGTFRGPDDASKVSAQDRQVIESGAALGPYEWPMSNADGEMRDWLVEKVPLKYADGEVRAVLTVGMDITTLKQVQAELLAAQEKLRSSERRSRDFAEISAHVTWEMGPDLRVTFMSDSVEAVTGLPPSHYVGKRNIDLDPDDPRRKVFEELLEKHQPIRDFAYSQRTHDARTVHMMFSAKPIFDAGGGFQGYRGTTRDVTAQRAAEMESERMRMARDLATAADMAKTKFLANMSHELRTPLNAILGFSELMGSEIFGPLGAKQYAEYVADIRKSGEHLMGTIGNLLDMTRIEMDEFDLKSRKMPLSKLIADGVATAASGAAESQAPISVAPIDPAWEVELDQRAMGKVLVALLSNARKFTPASGSVAVELRPVPNGALEVAIVDTGCGIAPERMKTVFEPFQQTNGMQARAGEGAGLSLWVSKALCVLHGGELRLESVEGCGTVATITLPAERVVGRPHPALKAAG